MPSSKGYSYKSNSQGNYSCARDYGNSSSSSSSANPNSYQYPSASGSIHYSTPKSERYQNDGNGGSPYTSASGYRTCSGYGKNVGMK